MDKEEKQKYIHEIKTQCPPSLNTKYVTIHSRFLKQNIFTRTCLN